ncbi:MAG: cytochrome c family protein [Sphingomonas bacterium]|nr:cytochrome c family protein [Sphingomonas bacterium]MDB5717559.1 cytochrome c family protein [Sphingomonas bacterium]
MTIRLPLLIALAAIGSLAPLAAAVAQPAPATPNPAPAPPKPRSAGEAVFLDKCRYCHVEMGPGTLTLAKRLGPENGLLAARPDLDAGYVKAVVRNGLNTMPPINRVEVSDAELDTIATWLATHNKGRKPAAKPAKKR